MKIIPPSESIPAEFSFREGKNQDSDQIVSLVHSVLIEFGLKPEPQGIDQDLIAVEESYRDGYFGVVETEGKIVATYGLFPINKEVVEIRKMYAHPNVRGKGLGIWMVKHLIDIAKYNGYREVELETASPLKAAIRLYQKLGFIEKDFEHKTPRCDKSFYLTI